MAFDKLIAIVVEPFGGHGFRRCPRFVVGSNMRAGVESQKARWKRVLGDALRFHGDQAQATEVAVGVAVLNRMLDLGRPNSVRVA